MKKLFLSLLMSLFAAPALAQDEIEELLRRAAEGMKSTVALEAAFVQEKQIPFLDVPLMAEGKLCFRVPQGEHPFVFWEYRSPARSGFQYEEGSVSLWSGEGEGKAASSTERAFLSAMVEQMLTWIAFDREALGKEYELASVERNAFSLLLTPKNRHPVFSSIVLEFSRDFTTLQSIRMTGHQGDTTLLSFHPQTRNASLSGDCRR
ncbi:MAG: outer membrane lipoprotein carrier protein LolA [Mailhella sp.]|nr:outer membrane lipoprotein carrier protein LolA [Mailhella sp.]